MCHELLKDASVYALLLKIDETLCEAARRGGCPRCGGALHRGDYTRKPRGVDDDLLPEGYDRRLSLCCSADGCRKRVTPPSVRYLGRKVYLAAAVTIVSAIQASPKPWAIAKLQELTGVSRRTVMRWRKWWRETFVTTSVWVAIRARMMPTVDQGTLPHSLLERFIGASRDRLVALLNSIAPLTTTSWWSHAASG